MKGKKKTIVEEEKEIEPAEVDDATATVDEMVEPDDEIEESRLHYDEDTDAVVKRKPMPRKAKLILEHIGFVLAIMVVSVVLAFVYFESTQIDLEKYYIVGSYRVVSLEKVYPDSDLVRESTSSYIGKLDNGKKRFDQTIVYSFKETDGITADEASVKYIAELKEVVNGFNDLPSESRTLNPDEYQLVKKENNKVFIRIVVTKNTELNTLKIVIVYEVEA